MSVGVFFFSGFQCGIDMGLDLPQHLCFLLEILECCIVRIVLLFQFCIPGLNDFAVVFAIGEILGKQPIGSVELIQFRFMLSLVLLFGLCKFDVPETVGNGLQPLISIPCLRELAQIFHNHYLQVAPEVRELLQERWDSCARGYGEAGELTSQQAQECALYFLEQCFPEEGTEDVLPLDAAKGTSYQKATVAAMTLRYYGVPARYAEGYIITAEMAVAAGENGSISVRGTDAGAWVEVYQDGIGWIPMDLTPGMGETIREEPYSSVRSDDAEQKQGTKTEEKEKEEETDRPDGGTLVRLKRILDWSLLILPLLLLALIVLLILRRRYLLRCRETRFGSENCRDAVGWIFRDAVCLLERMGFDRGNGSLETLCPPVEERFGPEYARKLKDMIVLNGRAVFSSREMPPSARDSMLEFYGITLSYLKETSSWMKKLWMKWILCLY